MIREDELKNRLATCRQNIDGFHADIDQGDIPSFDHFEQSFIQLARDVQDFAQTNPHSRLQKDFETILGHFRNLGPKLEMSREKIRAQMQVVHTQGRGHMAYAKQSGLSRYS